MRLILSILLVAFCCTPSWAQDAIRGFVVDSATNKPIEGAAVFYENTMRGTSTNQHGFFVLRAETKIKSLLNIRALGYKQVRLEKPKLNQNQRFLLVEKDTQLETVYLNTASKPTTKSHSRESEPHFREYFLSYFKYYFLGGGHRRGTRIKNLDKINISHSPDKKNIKFSSKRPLEIENEYLGYTITYYLDNFVINRKESELASNLANDSYQHLGNGFFKELNPDRVKNKYKKRRNEVYQHSILRLMRALADSSLAKNGFKLVNEKGEDIALQRTKHKSFTEIKPPSVFYVYRAGDIKNHDKKTWEQIQFILEKIKPTPLTKVIAKQNFGIDKWGNFFPHDALRFEGYLGKKGYSDALPLDFQPYE
ncbi:carboxypeptidase-like regulatory domain-containing protein [Haloflavibacter putidus]|uniref:Carboxypeptidase-like regulatory domain-containing protein n=1 Tax=Haloflavibacter putidus TaxID=2576776 RepID=A0A507ZJR9_9FLAO|nr:carboxypeptidase-like regulatory domain-containing protein [Haloflavibacter putidus]TQD36931.1 carboxypeptidase-like regulatory domain-containing protein [Haloflavibacter putidus]